MRSIGHFIGGKEVKGTSGRTADVFEPMTGDVQAKVALASKAEVRAAVENAKAAQAEWAATNPQRRARVMMKFLEFAQRDYDKLAELLCGSGNRSAAHDGEHKAEVVPVDRVALIQHFRTSMVQYLGLVSYKMQVKRIVKAI